MRSSSVTHAKNNLSALLDQVRAGKTIIITDRNQAVAKLVPVDPSDKTDDQRLDELERKGLISRARGKVPDKFFKLPRGKAKPGGSVLDALLEERREGR